MLNSPCTSGMDPTWLWCKILFSCRIQLSSLLQRIVSVIIKDTALLKTKPKQTKKDSNSSLAPDLKTPNISKGHLSLSTSTISGVVENKETCHTYTLLSCSCGNQLLLPSSSDLCLHFANLGPRVLHYYPSSQNAGPLVCTDQGRNVG